MSKLKTYPNTSSSLIGDLLPTNNSWEVVVCKKGVLSTPRASTQYSSSAQKLCSWVKEEDDNKNLYFDLFQPMHQPAINIFHGYRGIGKSGFMLDYLKEQSSFQEESIEEEIEIIITDYVFKIPSVFNHLINEIKQSSYILELSDSGWDENGPSKGIKKELWKASIDFVNTYTAYIYSMYKIIILTPEIDACVDGTIDLAWKTSTARLLINVKELCGNYIVSYYRDNFTEFSKSKGNEIISDTVAEDFAVWMKNNLRGQ